MKAAIVRGAGRTPVYGDFAEPVASAGERHVWVKVIATARNVEAVHAIDGVLRATVPGRFGIAAKPLPLSEVEQAWPKDDSSCRTVFIMTPSRL